MADMGSRHSQHWEVVEELVVEVSASSGLSRHVAGRGGEVAVIAQAAERTSRDT